MRTNKIIQNGDEAKIAALIGEGLSLRELEDCTPYTFGELRTFRSHVLNEKAAKSLEVESGDFVQELVNQNCRLKTLLQNHKPREIETTLRIEQRLGENTKALISLQKEKLLEERQNEENAESAQIGALVASVQAATEDCKQCRNSIREALKPLIEANTHDTE